MPKTTIASPTAPAPVRLLLLTALPLMALLLYLDGQSYDPGLLDFRPQQDGSSDVPFPERIAGLQRSGQIRRYNADNLYEYINGHAEFFIGAGFQGLTVSEYGDDGSGQPRVVINLYHMGEALNAFGALVEESGDRPPVEVGSLGFRSGQGIGFIQGPYYAQISLFDPGLDAVAVARDMAAALTDKQDSGELAFRFPDFGPVTGTQFVREYYRGMEFFNRVLERSFQRGDSELQAFQISGSAEEITALGDSMNSFLADDAIQRREEQRSGLVFHRVDDPYEGEWFFVLLPSQFVGVYAPLTDELAAAIVEFANPAPIQ